MFKKYILITLSFSSFTYLHGMELEGACAMEADAVPWEQHAACTLQEMAQRLAMAKLPPCRTKRSIDATYNDEECDTEYNFEKTTRTDTMTDIHDSSLKKYIFFKELKLVAVDIYTLLESNNLFIHSYSDESDYLPTYSIHPEHISKIQKLDAYLLQALPPTTRDQSKLLKTSKHLLKFLHLNDRLLTQKLESLSIF